MNDNNIHKHSDLRRVPTLSVTEGSICKYIHVLQCHDVMARYLDLALTPVAKPYWWCCLQVYLVLSINTSCNGTLLNLFESQVLKDSVKQ